MSYVGFHGGQAGQEIVGAAGESLMSELHAQLGQLARRDAGRTRIPL